MAMMRVTGCVCRGPLDVAFEIDFFFFFIYVSCFFSSVFLSISLSCFLITVTCFLFTRLVSIPVYCLLFRSQRLCLVFHRRQTVATRFFESLTSTTWAFDERTRPVHSPPKLNLKKKWAVRVPLPPTTTLASKFHGFWSLGLVSGDNDNDKARWNDNNEKDNYDGKND